MTRLRLFLKRLLHKTAEDGWCRFCGRRNVIERERYVYGRGVSLQEWAETRFHCPDCERSFP